MVDQLIIVPCAACQHRRQRCHYRCPLSPHFPSDDLSLQNFINVHNLFGIDNIFRTIQNCQTKPERTLAMKSIIAEANARARDPYGLAGDVVILMKDIERLKQQAAYAKAAAEAATSSWKIRVDDVLDSASSVANRGPQVADANLGVSLELTLNAYPVQDPVAGNVNIDNASEAVVSDDDDDASDQILLKFEILMKNHSDQEADASTSWAAGQGQKQSLGSAATGFDLNLPRSPPQTYGVDDEMENDQDNAVTVEPGNEDGDEVAGYNSGGGGGCVQASP